MTAVKDLTDDELIDRIEETYGLRDYGGDVAELVRRYRWREHLVPSAPEKPVATPLRGSTGPCGCGAPLDSTGRCTWGPPTPRCKMPTTAAGVLELCQRVLGGPQRPTDDVRTLAEWVLIRLPCPPL
jgi:hypothetical protein